MYVIVKYRSDPSIYGWDTTTSGILKQSGSNNLKVGHMTPPHDAIWFNLHIFG